MQQDQRCHHLSIPCIKIPLPHQSLASSFPKMQLNWQQLGLDKCNVLGFVH